MKRFRIMHNKVSTVMGFLALSLLASISISQSTHALSLNNNLGIWNQLNGEQQDLFSQNNIIFYDPTECDENGNNNSSGEIDLSNNRDYEGNQIWTDEQLEAVKANKPFYEKAASEAGIPWQVIAAIHLREHSLLRDNPSNGQGIYQFFSSSEREKCVGGDFTPGKVSDQQFQIQTNCAAIAIRDSYGLKGTDDDSVKKTFFRYNGMASAYIRQAKSLGFNDKEANNGEGSPYVMNRYDAKRDPNKNKKWCQIKTDGGPMSCPANKDYGAFVYYKAIGGGNNNSSWSSSDTSTSSSSSGTTDSSGDSNDSESETSGGEGVEDSSDSEGTSSSGSSLSSLGSAGEAINKAAIKLAWPEGEEHNYDDPKPEYKEALEGSKLSEYGHEDVERGSSCDAFAKSVLWESGVDKDFYCCTVSKQREYMEAHPEKFTEIKDWSWETAKPGDIVTTSGHIMIAVEIDGEIKRADASIGGSNSEKRTGMIGDTYTVEGMRAWRATGDVEIQDECDEGGGGGNMDINKTAIELAWPADSGDHKCDDVKEEYKKALLETKTIKSFGNCKCESSSDCRWSRYGTSCSVFVSTVLRYSGIAPKASKSPGGLVKYMRAHPEIFTEVTEGYSKDNMQAGDIQAHGEPGTMAMVMLD